VRILGSLFPKTNNPRKKKSPWVPKMKEQQKQEEYRNIKIIMSTIEINCNSSPSALYLFSNAT